jgi:hypothetical protein
MTKIKIVISPEKTSYDPVEWGPVQVFSTGNSIVIAVGDQQIEFPVREYGVVFRAIRLAAEA